MFGKKKKNDERLDYTSLNSLIKVSNKVLDILFIFLIIILIYVSIRLLKDSGVLGALITLLKIVAPLFIGFIIAWLLDPLVSFLVNKGWKRSISTFTIFFLFIFLIVFFFYLVIPSLGRQLQDAIGMVPNVVDNFNSWITNFFDKLSNLYKYDFSSIKDSIYSSITGYTNSITLDLPNLAIKVVSKILSGGITLIISLFIAFYMLFDFRGIRETFISFLPKKLSDNFVILTDRLDKSLKNYVLGTFFVTVILFSFQSLGFFIAGLKAPLVFGLICAVTNIIPYIGPYIGGIPAVVVGFTISPFVGVLTLISVVVAQFLESYILTPLILSKTMKLHPVTIIIGLLIFEHFFGIIGMLLSTPIISCLKIIMEFINERFKITQKIKE